MINYIEKFSLKNKIAYVVGGSGYIGSEISLALISLNCKVVVLDKFPFTGKHKNKIIYTYLDLKKTKDIEKSLKKIIKKNGVPDILINASYPRTKNWKKNTFEQLTINDYEANIKIHLNSYIWI